MREALGLDVVDDLVAVLDPLKEQETSPRAPGTLRRTRSAPFRVVVLRHGQKVAELPASEVSEHRLIEFIVGVENGST